MGIVCEFGKGKMPGISKGLIFKRIQCEGLVLYSSTVWNKGRDTGPLFGEYSAFCWGNLIYFTVQKCGKIAGEPWDTERRVLFYCKAQCTENKFTYNNNFKTHPCKMVLFLLDLVLHMVYFILPRTYKHIKNISEGKKKWFFSFFSNWISPSTSLELQPLP